MIADIRAFAGKVTERKQFTLFCDSKLKYPPPIAYRYERLMENELAPGVYRFNISNFPEQWILMLVLQR